MLHALSNHPRVTALAIVILLVAVWTLVRLARLCLCDCCKDPYAVFQRGEMQLCHECAAGHDRVRNRRRRRRSLLRWIWRTSP